MCIIRKAGKGLLKHNYPHPNAGLLIHPATPDPTKKMPVWHYGWHPVFCPFCIPRKNPLVSFQRDGHIRACAIFTSFPPILHSVPPPYLISRGCFYCVSRVHTSFSLHERSILHVDLTVTSQRATSSTMGSHLQTTPELRWSLHLALLHALHIPPSHDASGDETAREIWWAIEFVIK